VLSVSTLGRTTSAMDVLSDDADDIIGSVLTVDDALTSIPAG
jgi:hypothetical protein